MNSHKNARTPLQGRKLLIERIGTLGLVPAALAAGISERTARKWAPTIPGRWHSRPCRSQLPSR